MNKKGIIILTLTSMIVIFLLAIFYEKGGKINKEDNVKLLFANNYISSIIKEDNMSFNIFGVRKIDDQKNLISEMISDIEFNNKNIKINSFSVDEGLIKSGYQLFNFIIEVEISGNNIEKANEFIIYFNNNMVKSYKIGNITLEKDKGDQKDDIEISNEFTIGYPTPSLDIDIMNNTKDNITLIKVNDLKEELIYNFSENTELKHLENYNILVPSFEQKNEYDFYTITPILQYSIGDISYNYDLPDVIYGILIPDDEKIQRIIE